MLQARDANPMCIIQRVSGKNMASHRLMWHITYTTSAKACGVAELCSALPKYTKTFWTHSSTLTEPAETETKTLVNPRNRIKN